LAGQRADGLPWQRADNLARKSADDFSGKRRDEGASEDGVGFVRAGECARHGERQDSDD